jgi:hypothetical protein
MNTTGSEVRSDLNRRPGNLFNDDEAAYSPAAGRIQVDPPSHFTAGRGAAIRWL